MSKNNNFWQKLKKPFFALAPMAGYTDQAFRLLCKDFGADVLFSEMVSSEAIWHKKSLQVESPRVESKNSLLKTLELIKFSKKERPFVVQIFGANPEHMAFAAQYIASGAWAKDYLKIENCKLKIESIPDGIDLNMGCPVHDVTKTGAGSALMKNHQLASEIIKAVKKVVKIPVSVKTRLGWSDPNEIFEFAKVIEKSGADALTIHGRTYKQGFAGPADLEIISKVASQLKIPVIANGGLSDPTLHHKPYLIPSTPCTLPLYTSTPFPSGYMVGRGAIGNPWIFDKVHESKVHESDRKKIILQHAELAYKLKGERGIIELRKHLGLYLKDLPNAKKLREKLVRVENISDIKNILNHS
jgi:tRNA-dihydrouridine synthase B